MKSRLMDRFSEQASIEEFIEGTASALPVAVNPVITEVPVVEVIEDFGGEFDDPMVEVDQAELVAGQLDELATDVDGITTAPAMESYGRIYTQMVSNLGYTMPSQPGLESFAKTRGGKRSLAKQIRTHASHLRRVAAMGLEDYVNSVDDKLKTLTDEYRTAIKELDSIKPNLDAPDEEVTVNEKSIWKMFHKDNDLITSPLTAIQEEEKNLRSLAGEVKRAVQRITSDTAEGDLFNSGDFNFLFNRDLDLSGTKVKVNDRVVPKPSRSYSGSDYAWIAVWSIVFNVVGLVGGLLFKRATGEEKTKSKRSTQEMHVFVDTVKKMTTIVKGVDDDIAKLKAYIEKKGDEAAGYKRDSSPVFQLAVFIVQQCTDLAKGSRLLFGKIANG